jgi:ankyrin repeat protein
LLRNVTLQWLWHGGDELKEIVHLLQENGARPDLWTALCFGHTEQLAGLLTENPMAVSEIETEIAPIHAAALLGNTEAIAVLLDHGASIHTRGCWSTTPLHLAI